MSLCAYVSRNVINSLTIGIYRWTCCEWAWMYARERVGWMAQEGYYDARWDETMLWVVAQVHRTKTCQHDRRRLSAVGRYTTGQYVTRATGTMATEANFTLLVSRWIDIQLYSRFFNTLEDYQHWIILK